MKHIYGPLCSSAAICVTLSALITSDILGYLPGHLPVRFLIASGGLLFISLVMTLLLYVLWMRLRTQETQAALQIEYLESECWPPAPTSPSPALPTRLGLFRPMADIPFWVLPIIAAGEMLIFTSLYSLRHHNDRHPIVWVEALIWGLGLGLMLSSVLFWFWLEAKKRRQDHPDE